MSTITFDVTQFRVQFPEFADPVKYPDAFLQMYWDNATCYISPEENSRLSGDCLRLVLNLMTAHLIAQNSLNATGDVSSIMSSATVDKVSVATTPPPINNQWQFNLNTTNYGVQVLSLLQVKGAGGFSAGGLPETASFRRVAGIAI